MMNKGGVFVGEVCHIEAAAEGGPRFNPGMANEDRRRANNLILLCHEHHRVVDDVDNCSYSVQSLRDMKKVHQERFSNPGKKIFQALVDRTRIDAPTRVKNLRRLYTVIEFELDVDQMADSVNRLNAYIDILRRIPIDLRRHIHAIVERACHMANTSAVEDSPLEGIRILLSDFAASHDLSLRKVRQIVRQLAAYDVAQIDGIEIDGETHEAIRLDQCTMEWWSNITSFCSLTGTHVETFVKDLDFSPFDD